MTLRKQWMILAALVASSALAQTQPANVPATVATISHDISAAFDSGVDVRLLAYQNYAPTSAAGATTEGGWMKFQTKETLRGAKMDTLTLPYTFSRATRGSRMSRLWPDPVTLKPGDLFLCVTVPWDSGSKVEGVQGTLIHIYPVQNGQDAIVATYRKLVGIDGQKDAAFEAAIGQALVDADPLLREYGRGAAMHRLKPPRGVPLLIKALAGIEGLNLPAAESKQFTSALRTAFTEMGSGDAEKKAGLVALVEALGSKNENIRNAALDELGSVCADGERYGIAKAILSTSNLKTLQDYCDQMVKSPPATAPNAQSSATYVLNWINK